MTSTLDQTIAAANVAMTSFITEYKKYKDMLNNFVISPSSGIVGSTGLFTPSGNSIFNQTNKKMTLLSAKTGINVGNNGINACKLKCLENYDCTNAEFYVSNTDSKGRCITYSNYGTSPATTSSTGYTALVNNRQSLLKEQFDLVVTKKTALITALTAVNSYQGNTNTSMNEMLTALQTKLGQENIVDKINELNDLEKNIDTMNHQKNEDRAVYNQTVSMFVGLSVLAGGFLFGIAMMSPKSSVLPSSI